MNNEIINFINRRWQNDCNWMNGNCYWFAFILCNRFPDLEIYYCPFEGHFYAGKNNQYYDWHGQHNLDGKKLLKFKQRKYKSFIGFKKL